MSTAETETSEDQRRVEFRDGFAAGQAYADAVRIGRGAPANVVAAATDQLHRIRRATVAYREQLAVLHRVEAETARLAELAETTDEYEPYDEYRDDVRDPVRADALESAVALLDLLGYGLLETPATRCDACAVPEHDTCSLTPGCPCCDDTITTTHDETPER
jgi:hypothetical protein